MKKELALQTLEEALAQLPTALSAKAYQALDSLIVLADQAAAQRDELVNQLAQTNDQIRRLDTDQNPLLRKALEEHEVELAVNLSMYRRAELHEFLLVNTLFDGAETSLLLQFLDDPESTLVENTPATIAQLLDLLSLLPHHLTDFLAETGGLFADDDNLFDDFDPAYEEFAE